MNRPVTALRLAVAKSGRTQRDIAEALDMSEQHFSRIVNGLHTSDHTRERIALELRQSRSDLFPPAAPFDEAA